MCVEEEPNEPLARQGEENVSDVPLDVIESGPVRRDNMKNIHKCFWTRLKPPS